jgi:hypothetical protein
MVKEIAGGPGGSPLFGSHRVVCTRCHTWYWGRDVSTARPSRDLSHIQVLVPAFWCTLFLNSTSRSSCFDHQRQRRRLFRLVAYSYFYLSVFADVVPYPSISRNVYFH